LGEPGGRVVPVPLRHANALAPVYLSRQIGRANAWIKARMGE
jgi:hypothetical protein